MSSRTSSSGPEVVQVTPSLLRGWELPKPTGTKYSRGEVLVIGGARGTPGAAMLAGISALRVGAGRLTLAVARSVAVAVAVTVPESGVIPLEESLEGTVLGRMGEKLQASIQRADAILIGPGLDHPEETAQLLQVILPAVGDRTAIVLDAFALGVLPDLAEDVRGFHGSVVLTPNEEEAARLLQEEVSELADAVPRIARAYGAVVTAGGHIANPGDGRWKITTGHSGLGTSGSGDVLAGAIVGLLARGAQADQAACWGTHAHAAAGDRLTARTGQLGFLARELTQELPVVLTELRT